MFDRLLLVSCICIVVASIIYFFYWNRFLGFLIGRLIRLLSWNKEASSVWVEIGSIHFSIIAGRILFKDVRYYSSNQTIKVVKGQIQWRYWIRRPTSEEEIGLYRNGEDAHSPSKQCRVQLSLQGLEWYLYNRTAAYEDIVSRMQEKQPPDAPPEPLSQKASRAATSTPFRPFPVYIPRWVQRAVAWTKQQLPELDPKDLLPLGLEVNKGAIILGNASTADLLVAEFQRSEGTFGVVESRCKLDLYKQILSIKFHQAEMRLVDNEDYVDPMDALGELVNGRIHQYSIFARPLSYLSHRSFVKLWDRLSLYPLTKKYARDRSEARSRRPPSQSRARRMFGKSSHSEPAMGSPMDEYAIERKILETPVLDLTYYYDAVGEVLSTVEEPDVQDTPPEWGFNIGMSEAIIRYGPWADRQRAEIQRIFFPLSYQDAVVTKPTQPGGPRPWAALQIFLEFNGGATLHIPFREASKDWQWDEKSDMKHQQPREPAMIHLSVGDRTTMNYTLPMIVNNSGYKPIMDLHLDKVLMTSTLNDIRLIGADSCTIHGEFPSPLRWDDERTWAIAISFFRPSLYLIRDHINMFTDLIKDWTAGPPTDYQRFVPTIYTFQFDFYHYDINLYVNDHNIIDKPLFRDENALITISGAHLKVSTEIFSNQYRPDSTSVPFRLVAPDVSLNLSLPRWNTNAIYDGKNGNNIGHIGTLQMEGYYRYFAVVRADAIEQLQLQFKLADVKFKALGWAIRYFMVLRENYFGSFTNFSTLSEYLEKRRSGRPLGDPVIEKYRPGKSNMLQVEIQLAVEDGIILLPASLTGTDSLQSDHPKTGSCMALALPELQLQLRIHDYYMDMSMNTSAIAAGVLQTCSSLREVVSLDRNKRALQIDGIHITANRLFGPTPHTSTYVCIWEIAVDHVQAKPSASDAHVFLAALDAFRINYSDLANAPAQEYSPSVEPDVTFVRVSLTSMNITWLAGTAALILTLPSGLKIGSNDLGGRYHRKVTNIAIPEVALQVLMTTTTHSPRNRWLEAARFTCDAFLDIYRSPSDLEEASRLQAEYVRYQDGMTRRGEFMVKPLAADSRYPKPVLHKDGLYLPHPSLPGRSRSSHPPDHPARPPARNRTVVSEGEESDTEEDVHSAAYDQKPLLSRPVAAIRHPAKDLDQEMSSGDESDNEDLTDGSSDSEWSDPPSPSRLSPEDTACKLYSNVVDQYTYAWSHAHPTTTDDPPFSRVRGSALLNSLANTKLVSLDAVTTEHDDSKNEETTTLHFKSKKGIDLIITPLVIFACVQFSEDFKRYIFEPGLSLDSLMVKYTGDFKDRGHPKQLIQLSIQLPKVSLAILQRVIVDQGRPIISELPSSTEMIGDIGLDVIVVTQATFAGIAISGHHSRNEPALSIVCSHSSIGLDLSIDKRTLSVPKPSQFLFSCSVSSLSVELSDATIALQWDDLTSHLGHLGPEYIVATFVALSSTSKALLDIVKPMLKRRSNARKAIIEDIIRTSSDKATIDPLSTIQPSYLVQTGRPFSLRTDPVFRFLYHLRVCLWHSPWSGGRNSFLTAREQDRASNDALLSLVEDRLAAMDPDQWAPHFLVHLAELMHLKYPSQLPRQSHPFSKGRLQLSRLTLTIVDPAGHASSNLSICDVSANITIRSGELLRQVNHPASVSQTSLKDRRHQRATNAWTSISCGDFRLSVCPHLMSFAQNLLRVRRFWKSGEAAKGEDRLVLNSSIRSSLQSIISVVNVKQLRVQAAAENLMFELAVKDLLLGSDIVNRSQSRQSMSHTASFEEVSIRARSPSDQHRDDPQDILAYAALIHGKMNALIHSESSEKIVRLFFTTGLQLSVPRSALKLYRFIEEWRADYLPGMEAMLQALVAELDQTPFSKPKTAPGSLPSFDIHGHFSHLGISLQVMHGTWLSWKANPSIIYAKTNPQPAAPTLVFGAQIGPMSLEITSAPDPTEAKVDSRIKLSLPPIMVTGSHSGDSIRVMGLIKEIDLKVKLSHWDTLLVVQQKFGQDFHDLLALVHKTQSLRQSKKSTQKRQSGKSPLAYGGFLKIQGFRLALEGPASTAYLECLDIGGGIDNEMGRKWNINLSDLTLSLGAHDPSKNSRPELTRTHRPAFVTLDIGTKGGEKSADGGESPSINTVHVAVTKMHAVMQPSSIGQLADFVDYLQVEILARKEQRVMELAAFKDKTRSILKTLEAGVKDFQTEKKSWLDEYVIEVSARNVGVAFPLSLEINPGLSFSRVGRDVPVVPAFLWSIKSIGFSTHHAETGHFTMKGFALQFIARFSQTDPSDYTAEKHKTRNQLVYPEMEAQLTSTNTRTSRRIQIGANVSGFILDIDSNIPSYVFSLVDVYRLGKERVDRLSASLPRSPLHEVDHLPPIRQASSEPGLSSSNISGSLIFASGKVRLYNKTASKQWEERLSRLRAEPSDDQVMTEVGADVFNLPVVSLWTEYSTSNGPGGDLPEASLVFRATIHSSQNILRPNLLPFMTEIVNHVEARMRKQTSVPASTSLIPIAETPASVDSPMLGSTPATLKISFGLRIDQSKLELTCQPDVNVVAGLHWNSGGFIINVSPGAQEINFTGSVGGLTIGLKHGFLSDDCVKLDARNLAFSVGFSKGQTSDSTSTPSISAVIETELLGGVRFSRLQDILCFKAVWLDRIPILSGQSIGHSREPSHTTPITPRPPQLVPKPTVKTVVLVRIRQIVLEVDLGQSISVLTLELQDAILRTKLTRLMNEVSVSVDTFAINAKGNVSGHARVQRCVFETTRGNLWDPAERAAEGKMLKLQMTSGPLVVSLESDHQQLLHYRAEPLQVNIFDDWSVKPDKINTKETPLKLAFTVDSPEIVAVATIATIPKLLTYVHKFQTNVEVQRQGAARESRTFRITRTPKPDNPLSAVAEAMLHSARSRFKEMGTGLSYVILQHMSLHLNLLRLIVFPRTMDDMEIAHFIGRDVKARFDRLVESDEPSGKRDLLLSFSSISISKHTGLGHPPPTKPTTEEEWLTSILSNSSEAIIVGLPSMVMHMVSEEKTEEQTRVLLYDFHSTFVRHEEGLHEEKDIYITLNMSLYSWLTLLRKSLSREMDQVRIVNDWNSLVNAAPSEASKFRKPVPEPLNIDDTPTSTPEPSSNRPFSPFSPTTALRSSTALSPGPLSAGGVLSAGPSPRHSTLPSMEMSLPPPRTTALVYRHRTRHIERLRMRQLGEATPDVMHPFFMKKAGFNLEDSLPQYVNEYATVPLEEIMEFLLKLYSRQLLANN